jgi:hypothetical protein
MEPTAILALLNGMISTAFTLYKMLKQISGDAQIPTWNELLKKNADLQAEIDGEMDK